MVLLVTTEHTGTKQLAPRRLPYTNWLSDRCSFPYIANFMAKVVGLALSNSATSCCVIYILHSKLPWFQWNLRTEQHPANWEMIYIWNRNNLLIYINMNTIEINIKTFSWPILSQLSGHQAPGSRYLTPMSPVSSYTSCSQRTSVIYSLCFY